jgi:hypothetical protein
MIGTGSKYIKNVDDLLTLEGLRIIWERNSSTRKDSPAAKSESQAEPKASSKSAQSKSAQPKSGQPKSKNGDGAPASSPSRSAR